MIPISFDCFNKYIYHTNIIQVILYQSIYYYICNEYLYLIRHDYKNRDKSLEYLAGIVTDLFMDWNRLNGYDGKSKLPILHNTIMNSNNFNNILKQFIDLSHKR